MKTLKIAGGVVGALVVGAVIMLTTTKVVYPAISSLVGLAVAQSSTAWNNVKDAAAGDNLTSGVLMSSLALFDGTNFDRARGDTTNGLDVDVTRLPGGAQTPADDFANPTTFQGTWALPGIFDGTTWDRWRGQVASVQGQGRMNASAVGVANTALTVTLTGVAGKQIHLYRINNVACTPEGASNIIISDGGATVYNPYVGGVPAAPMGFTEVWPTGLTAGVGADMVITVSSCGPGNLALFTYEADQF